MKKILLFTICLISLPFIAFALESISDNELENVTGATGINIQFTGDLTIDIDMIKIGWGDTDGIGSGTSQCFLTLEATGTPSRTKLRLSTSNPLFIVDIATTSSTPLSIGGNVAVEANTTYIKLDLPDDITAEIVPCGYTDIKLVENPLTGTGSSSFGRLETKNLRIYLQSAPTNIYISAHN